MKTLLKLLFFVACIGILAGCQKDELFPDQPDPILKKAVKVMVQPCPSTDVLTKAETDWQNINDALQNAGPGETVQLAAGTFYLHKSVVCWDFNGTLRGEGRNKTTIQTAPGFAFDVSDCPALEWSWSRYEGHAVICFPHSPNKEERTVCVSDLTLIANEPATDWDMGNIVKNTLQGINVHYTNLIGSGASYDNTLSDRININVNYKNIKVIGEYEPGKYNGDDYSLRIGVSAFGASSGSFKATDIIFKDVDYCICPHAFCGDNSEVTIKEVKVEKANLGLYSWTCSSWAIQDSEFSNCLDHGIFLDTYDNLFDYPYKNTIIKDNLFVLDTRWNGITGLRLNNVDVKDNIFTGNCRSGVLARFGSYWEIKDNDFCGLTVNDPEMATIRLDGGNINSIVKDNANQVVGGSSATDISNIIEEGKECYE